MIVALLRKAVKAFFYIYKIPLLPVNSAYRPRLRPEYKNVASCGVSEIASKFGSLQTASCAVCWVKQRPSPDVVTHRSGAWENKRRRQMRTEEKHGFGNKFHSKAWIYANLRCISANRNRPILRGSEKEECIITLFPRENILGWKKRSKLAFVGFLPPHHTTSKWWYSYFTSGLLKNLGLLWLSAPNGEGVGVLKVLKCCILSDCPCVKEKGGLEGNRGFWGEDFRKNSKRWMELVLNTEQNQAIGVMLPVDWIALPHKKLLGRNCLSS